MPGITGFFTNRTDHQNLYSHLTDMVDCMLHEPFYTHGTYCIPERGCYVGWVWHEDSFADCNPMISPNGDVILIFTGEHLVDSGDDRSRPSRTKATSLLDLYEARGVNFVQDLNGWFSGVLVDLRKQMTLLFNDRFGVSRVYYHEHDGTFAFSSEAKSLLAIYPETRTLDPQGLGQFLAFGSLFQNRTLFEHVSLLPGGSAWTFERHEGMTRRQYFDVGAWESQPTLAEGLVLPSLAATVSRVFPKYFAPSDHVGLSLTGGLDTRILMAGRPRPAAPAPCYTYRGVYRDCFDVDVARDVAATSGLPHHVIRLDTDFFEQFSTFAEKTVWVTEGSLDLSGAHEIYYSRRARELAPIRVTGNYGSEVLRSVTTFKPLGPPLDLFDAGVRGHIATATTAFGEVTTGHPVTFSAFRDIPWHLFGRLAAAQSQMVVRSPYMDNDLVALIYQIPAAARRSNELSLRLIASLDPALAAISTDMGYGMNASGLLAEATRIYRYLLFKAEWYYNAGMPHWLARADRRLLRAFEPLFLGAHKIDHYRVWFRDQLFDYVQTMLQDRSTASRPYLDQRQLQQIVTAHERGTHNYVNEITNILTLELVHRLLLDKRPAGHGRVDQMTTERLVYGTSHV